MRGSISGTSLNTALNQIAKKRDDIKAAYGFDVPVDEKGNLLFVDFLKLLNQSTEAMDKLSRSGDFGDLFNLRGMRSILPITNEKDIKRLIDLTESIAGAKDEARQAAIIMDSGFGGAFRRAVSAVDDLNISLGKLQSGPLTAMLNTVPHLTGLLDQLINKYQGFTLLLAASPAIALAAGGSMMVLSFILKNVGSAVGVIRSLTGIGGKAALLVASNSMITKGAKKLAGLRSKIDLSSIGKYPTGAASTIPGAATSQRAAQAFNARLAARANAQAKAAQIQQLKGGIKVLAAEKAITDAIDLRKTIATASIKKYQETVALGEKEVALAAKKLANVKATNLVVSQHNTMVLAQVANAEKILNLEKELKNISSARGTWEAKLTKAANARNVGAATNAGKHIAALKAQERAVIGTVTAMKNAMGTKLGGLLTPLSEAEALAGLQATKQAAAGSKAAMAQRVAAQLKFADATILSSKTAAAAQISKTSIANKMAQSRVAATQARMLPIGAPLAAGRGAAMLKMIGNIGKLSKTMLSFGSAASKFVFSMNGVTTIFTFLLTFGDRIPYLNGLLEKLGSGFKTAFGQIGSIASRLGPSFDLIRQGFNLLGNSDTSSLGFSKMITGLQTMSTIVSGSLSAAWHGFFMELGTAWDRTKQIVGTMWELFNAVTAILTVSLGEFIGSVFERLRGILNELNLLFTGESAPIGDIFESVVRMISTVIIELSAWSGRVIIELSAVIQELEVKLERTALKIVSFMETILHAIPGGGLIAPTGASKALAALDERDSTRYASEERSLDVIDKAQADFYKRLDELFKSNTYTSAQEKMTEALKGVYEAMDFATRSASVQSQLYSQDSFSPENGSDRMAVLTEELAAIRYDTNRYVAALVGSGQNTRGNIGRGVTQDEVKEQTRILKEIRDEIALQNDRGGDVFRP
jgi:hypothetical protein